MRDRADDLTIPPRPIANDNRATTTVRGCESVRRHWLSVGLEGLAIVGGSLLFATVTAMILIAWMFGP